MTIEKFEKGVGAGAGIIGGLDSLFGWSARRQENAQKRLMDKQQSQWKEQQQILADYQLAQWNRENEYNDPTNYYKRLFAGAAANGINPKALIGDSAPGSVGQSATGVTAPGSTSPPGVGGVQQQSIAAGMNQVMAGMRQRAEISLLEAQARNLEQQNKESDSRIDLNRSNQKQMDANTVVLGQAFLTEQERTSLMRCNAVLASFQVNSWQQHNTADLAKKWAEVANLKANTDNKRKEGYWIDSKAQAYLDQSKARVALDIADRLLKNTLRELYGEEKAMQMLENDLYRRTLDSKVKIIDDEARWSGVYQFSQVFDNPYTAAALITARGDIVEVLTTELANSGLLETLPKKEREQFMSSLEEIIIKFAKKYTKHSGPTRR